MGRYNFLCRESSVPTGVCIHMCIYMSMCVSAFVYCTHMHTFLCTLVMQVCVSVLRVFASVCMCRCIHEDVCTCLCMSAYLCVCICVEV